MDTCCITLLFIRNELTALGRVLSFEACCQAQISRLVTRHYYYIYCAEVRLSFCQ